MADTGKILPLVTGGSGSGVVFGDPATGFMPGMIQYIDLAGNQYGDAQATRESSNTKQTQIESNVYAQLILNDGITESLVQADNVNTPFSLTFDGIIDINQAILDWNTANPTDTVTLISGTGAEIILAGTYSAVGAGTSGLEMGEVSSIPIPPSQGSAQYLNDILNGNVAFNFAGNLTPLFGQTTIGTLNGFFGAGGGNFVSSTAFRVQLFSSDFSTYQATHSADSGGVGLDFNGASFGITPSDYVFEDNSGNQFYWTHPFTAPSVGDVMTITNVAGSSYKMEFQTPSSTGLANGTLPFQFWRWNDNLSAQNWDQVWIATAPNTSLPSSNVIIGEDAGGLNESTNPYGIGYANTIIGGGAAQSLSSVISSETSRNVVIGANAASTTIKMENSIVVGYQALLGGTDQIIGSIIMTPDVAGSTSGNAINQNIALGYGTYIQGERNVVIGTVSFNSITSSALDNVSIGTASSTSLTAGKCNTAIGANSGSGLSTGDYNTFLGYGTSNGGGVSSHSIALGTQAQISNDHQLVIGGIAGTGGSGAIYNIKFNNGVTDTSGQIYEWRFTDVLTSVTDAAGSLIQMYAGTGTGSGDGSQWNFLTSLPTLSGTAQHANYKALSLNGIVGVLGDVDGINNSNKIIVHDGANFVHAVTKESFNVFSTTNLRYLRIDYVNEFAGLGDVDNTNNGTYVFINDVSQQATLRAQTKVSLDGYNTHVERGLVYAKTHATTTNYTAQLDDHVIRLGGGSNNIDVSLPDISTVSDGKVYRIKDTDGTAITQTLRIVPFSGDSIDFFAGPYVLSGYEGVTLIANPALGNWEIY